jgi:hypothetical protein
MSSIQFFVRTDLGETIGPIDAVELKRMAISGELTHDCEVQRVGGSGTWRSASSINGLVFAKKVLRAEIPSVSAPKRPKAPTDPIGNIGAWWYVNGGDPQGPFPAAIIMQDYKAANSPIDWQVLLDGTKDWMPIEEAPWFIEKNNQRGPTAPRGPALTNGMKSPKVSPSNGPSFTEQVKDSFLKAVKTIPSLLMNPIKGVIDAGTNLGNRDQIIVGCMINVLGTVVMLLIVWMKFHEFAKVLETSKVIEAFLKVLLLLSTPFIALAATNIGVRKIVTPQSKFGLGFDFLAAATALLPIQIAIVLAIMTSGPGMTPELLKILAAVFAYTVVLSAQIVYAVNANAEESAGIKFLFLTPIQLTLAIYLTYWLGSEFISSLSGMPMGMPTQMPYGYPR